MRWCPESLSSAIRDVVSAQSLWNIAVGFFFEREAHINPPTTAEHHISVKAAKFLGYCDVLEHAITARDRRHSSVNDGDA
ncbi:hypothetical protein NDU88_001222 [Pleurodeles waltl]|uniref:Uncharacterized protein n=1 Tax=Pleurodeles waltl TaxID=8319 RepID=A0AAV7SZM6_PLEWA|nr:hypothetical protein NDU88_001222 [Pleurodeles waltl]